MVSCIPWDIPITIQFCIPITFLSHWMGNSSTYQPCFWMGATFCTVPLSIGYRDLYYLWLLDVIGDSEQTHRTYPSTYPLPINQMGKRCNFDVSSLSGSVLWYSMAYPHDPSMNIPKSINLHQWYLRTITRYRSNGSVLQWWDFHSLFLLPFLVLCLNWIPYIQLFRMGRSNDSAPPVRWCSMKFSDINQQKIIKNGSF